MVERVRGRMITVTAVCRIVYLACPKRDILAVNFLVVGEHEGVGGIQESRGGAPPDEENHLAFFAHVRHWR